MSFVANFQDIPTSPSWLWTAAAKLEPKGSPWAHSDTTCVMCGAEVRHGDIAEPAGVKVFDDAFNNKPDVKWRGDAVCGHCVRVRDKRWMQANSKSYAVYGQGVFRLSRNVDIARFVLDPPAEPYVAIFNTRQQQHMVWRSVVGLPDQNQVIVRIDDDLAVIDTTRVRDGIRAWQTCVDVAADMGKPGWTPFYAGKNITNDAFVGRPREFVCEALVKHEPQVSEAIEILGRLTTHEWWATYSAREVFVDDPQTWPPRVNVDEAQADDE